MVNTKSASISPLDRPIHRELPLQPLRALRNVVLLGGTVWLSGLRAAIGRSVLDLPVTDELTVLEIWRQRLAELAGAIDRTSLPVRVVMAHGAPMPTAPASPASTARASIAPASTASASTARSSVAPASAAPALMSPVPMTPELSVAARAELLLERDVMAFRGTGGVLRDLTTDEAPGACILVANAAQLLFEPLAPLVTQLAHADADVSFVAHYDGTPCRLMLIRCRALRVLPRVGFVDLMEQGLPLIAADHHVVALHRAHAASLPVRTLGG
ncbi:MAG: hypothetical protein ABIP55_13345, partial [Tepidisphaeraceae bacterium]